LVAQQAFDLVLLDIMMPQMSGYEVLERLKADERTRRLPVIMISAIDDMDSVVKCIELGAEDYLFKPFNPVLLKARIGAILGRQVPELARHEIEQAQSALASLLAAGLTEAQQGLAGQVEQHLNTLSQWLKVQR
jgi:DNA-binding response OmpR family regulator